MKFDLVSKRVIGCAIEVHRALGPGLLESTYAQCLAFELGREKLRFHAEKAIPIVYRGTRLEVGYRVDLLVEDKLIVELKSVRKLTRRHAAQLLTDMKLADVRTGLLLNFNTTSMRHGIRRFVN